ncbi:Crp/Fnr family transcriptional regulator [Rubrobacter marinus]|uniref:Crp/Fnr family transcriptional regulator n=1 Tax=Rubrobacter marinus TaxID=2653852 RepID=UPI00140CE2C9|nr:Crp/Fnr family transcriptional regulator [Rubrobacter marinus]
MIAGEDARLLSLVDVFEPLSAEEIEDISWSCASVRLRAGEVLFGEDDLNETLFVLKNGRVRVYRRSPEGREFTLCVVEGGTVFGEVALTSRGTRGAYAHCMEDSELSILRRADVERLVLRKPEVGLSLIRLLSERLSAYERRLEDLGLKEVPARLASLILLLIEREGIRTRAGYKIPTRYTHHHLGTMIGANREAVTRAFTQLRETETVETENRLIRVRDIEALERAAAEGLPVRV